MEVCNKPTLEELAQYLDQGLLPEVVPTRQERSLRSALAMLSAGRELLLDRGLNELSIEAVCELTGTTVGSFYGRFGSKEAFFQSLQRLMLIRSQARLARKLEEYKHAEVSIEGVVRDIVHLGLETFRTDQGVMRASLQHAKNGLWRPIKAGGDRYRAALVEIMLPLLPLPAEVARLRVLFAYQAFTGVLVSTVLNNPGPLGLDDEALGPELERLINAYLKS